MNNIKLIVVGKLASIFRLVQKILFYHCPHKKPFSYLFSWNYQLLMACNFYVLSNMIKDIRRDFLGIENENN